MSCKLLYTPEALMDLDSIWMDVWEASRDIDTADQYIDGLRAAVRQKTSFPQSGTPLNLLGQFTGIRYVRYKRYLAFYRIIHDNMEVERVLFDASDYMRILFGISVYH